MQSIEIRTTQNVTIEYELASLRDRFLAFLIDGIIVGGAYFLLLLGMLSMWGEALFGAPMLAYFVLGLLPIGGFLLYHFFSEVLANGQSWGKRSMGIKVVRLDGKEPELGDYLLRMVFHLVDTIASAGVLGALLISSSLKNQRLGDMTANTTVIRVRQQLRFRLDDILRIDSIAAYEPSYPEVRQLSEKDMLLVKTVINRYRGYRNEAHRQVVIETADHLRQVLGIGEPVRDELEFLKTLIRDYIVLTR